VFAQRSTLNTLVVGKYCASCGDSFPIGGKGSLTVGAGDGGGVSCLRDAPPHNDKVHALGEDGFPGRAVLLP